MKLAWTPTAIRDLESLHRFIAEKNPTAAATIAAHIKSSVAQIGDFPHRGRPGRLPETRELVLPQASVFVPYEIVEGEIRVLAVIHFSRRWPPG